jgi:Holliday junction DNA helicase RuvA
MIGSLRGTILERFGRDGPAAEVLIEVGGVGYRTLVPVSVVEKMGPPGSQAFLHVHTHVRDDAIVLYGFSTREELSCFELLIAAHGVGPAVALAMLAVHTPAALRRAVGTDDAESLMLVPGIGRKTATRLILELKSRFDDAGDSDDPVFRVVGQSGAEDGTATARRADVRTALAGLGYAGDEIRQVLAQVPGDVTLEEQIRLALRELAAAR